MVSRTVGYLATAVAIVLLASAGWCGTAIVSHVYQDHLMIDAARAGEQQRLLQAAEQLRQQQQQQAAQAPKPPQ